MASVHLRFIPPDQPDLTKLRIYEGPDSTGPFNLIEEITPVGGYPDYISEYTTTLAGSLANWFAIEWEDSKGARTDLSAAVQGGTTTFVGEIIALVMARDATLDPQVVQQEAEAAVETYFGTDPYTVTSSTVRFSVKVGLARLVQARSMLNSLITSASVSASSGWTSGLVSMKSGTDQAKQSESLIRYLLQAAAESLGFGIGRIAQMAVPTIAGGLSEIVTADISRLLIEVE